MEYFHTTLVQFKLSKHWDGDITLKLGEDIPIVVDFNVDKASFEYILAPRVERE